MVIAIELLALLLGLGVGVFMLVLIFDEVRKTMNHDAPFVEAPMSAVQEAIAILSPQEDEVIYDLGCGDGRVLIEIAKRAPKAKVIGIEKGVVPFCKAWWKTWRYPQIRLRMGDFYQAHFSDANALFLYLFDYVLDELEPTLDKELAIGTRVITLDYKFSNRTPEDTIELETKNRRGKVVRVYRF